MRSSPIRRTAFRAPTDNVVGLEQGWLLARAVRKAIAEDAQSGTRRPIVAIVDVKSQAYGYREETLGIHLACAAAVDAYASARDAGHPVVALIVGPAMSGAFLAHGYQANRILALDAPGTLVHAMGKEAAPVSPAGRSKTSKRSAKPSCRCRIRWPRSPNSACSTS